MVVEEEEYEGEDGGEYYGGEEGGLSQFPFEIFSSSRHFPPKEPSSFEGFELSTCNLEVLSS